MLYRDYWERGSRPFNYLILGFDKKGALTSLVWPELTEKGRAMTFGAAGYRDALCGLIEATVCTATMDENDVIRITFASQSKLLFRLSLCQSEGERAILTGPKNYLFVFSK
jgi:hypothetical protein